MLEPRYLETSKGEKIALEEKCPRCNGSGYVNRENKQTGTVDTLVCYNCRSGLVLTQSARVLLEIIEENTYDHSTSSKLHH